MSDQKFIEEIRGIWEMVKDSFREKLPESTFNLWFGELEVVAFEDDMITMGISSAFKFKIIQEKYTGNNRRNDERFC